MESKCNYIPEQHEMKIQILKWEKTAEINIGIDFAFLQSKISGTIEVYQKTYYRFIGYPRTTALEGGNVSRVTFDNAGEIKNKGIELFIYRHLY